MEDMDFVRSFRPMARVGTLEDVANAAEYLASDLASFVRGQHLLLSGAHLLDRRRRSPLCR